MRSEEGGVRLRKMTEAWIQPTVRKSTAPSPRLKTSKASSAFSILVTSLLLVLLRDAAGWMASSFFSEGAMVLCVSGPKFRLVHSSRDYRNDFSERSQATEKGEPGNMRITGGETPKRPMDEGGLYVPLSNTHDSPPDRKPLITPRAQEIRHRRGNLPHRPSSGAHWHGDLLNSHQASPCHVPWGRVSLEASGLEVIGRIGVAGVGDVLVETGYGVIPPIR